MAHTETFTPTPGITNTLTNKFTDEPTYTLTQLPASTASLTPAPTVTPSWTPLPTTLPDDVQKMVEELLVTNRNCELPCYWGIVPGETKNKRSETLFDGPAI